MDGSTFTPGHLTPVSAEAVLGEQPGRHLNKRETAKALTRSKVRNAAEALFDTVGYERATIRDIAAKAGMSTGAVFANFKDKLALYVDIKGHAPVTIEQGHELFHIMRDLLPEIEAAITSRQMGGGGEPWAHLEGLYQRASVVVETIKATASAEALAA